MSLPILHPHLPNRSHLWCEIWHLFNGCARDDTAVFNNKQKRNTPGKRQRAWQGESLGILRVCLHCYLVVDRDLCGQLESIPRPLREAYRMHLRVICLRDRRGTCSLMINHLYWLRVVSRTLRCLHFQVALPEGQFQ